MSNYSLSALFCSFNSERFLISLIMLSSVVLFSILGDPIGFLSLNVVLGI